MCARGAPPIGAATRRRARLPLACHPPSRARLPLCLPPSVAGAAHAPCAVRCVQIVLNFFTAYLHDGELIGSYKLIAKHYLRSWFVPDLISSLPFDWFIFGITFSDPDETGDNVYSFLLVIKVRAPLRPSLPSRAVTAWPPLASRAVAGGGGPS